MAAPIINLYLICMFVFQLYKVDAGIPDFCLKPLNIDDCKLPQLQVYFYDQEMSTCKAGVWRGCATDNMFETELQCTQLCVGIKKSDELPDFCLEPLNTDDCKKPNIQVYFYDKRTSTCRAGVWRGCATENMFETKPQCNKFCVDLKKNKGLPDFCLKPLNVDDCKLPQKQVYFYDSQMSTCKAGVWRGCATDNMFETKSQCNKFCVDLKKNKGLPDFCLKPLNVDDCELPQEQVYFYDSQSSTCKAGVWRGCATDNMFETESQCSQYCAKTNETEEVEIM